MVDSFFEPQKRSKSPQFLRPLKSPQFLGPLENVEKSTVLGPPKICPQKWPFFRVVDSRFWTPRPSKIEAEKLISCFSQFSKANELCVFTPRNKSPDQGKLKLTIIIASFLPFWVNMSYGSGISQRGISWNGF